ncbi:hypothetical protein LguiB_014279 [Lonicera macranthoides]
MLSLEQVTFIGGGPYIMRPVLQDLSKLLTTTPLLINPVSTAPAYTEGEPSDEYFIGVKFIRVDGKLVSFNNSLLTIDKNGNGGTKLSTIVPYTVLHNSIYKAFASAFVKAAAAKNMKRVALVRPFGVCFSATANGSVPYVDLVLQSESVKWRFYEANSMVKVNKDVMCLGIKEWRTEPKNRSGFSLSRCKSLKGSGCVGCNLPPRPGCTNNTCGSNAYNPYKNLLYAEGFGQDKMTTLSTDGQFVLYNFDHPKFPFSCSNSALLKGLASGTKGMIGLARTKTSLHK